MIKLEDLEVESYVAGLEPAGPVLVIYVKHTGEGACTVKSGWDDPREDALPGRRAEALPR